MTPTESEQLKQLISTMRLLRSEHGCNWDRAQTPESLRPYIIEEAYELVDAIDNGDNDEILAELGDLLLQIVFQAQIFSERGLFGLGEIAQGIDNKLRRRHPQIFSTDKENAQHPDWEQIKQQELKEKGKPTDFASRLPNNLPALKLADKVCRYLKNERGMKDEKASRKVPPSPDPEDWNETEQGARLYAAVAQAHQQGIDSELALRKYVLNLLSQQSEQENKNDDSSSSQ